MKKLYLTLLLLLGVSLTKAEDGHSLWLRMSKNDVPANVRVQGVKKSAVVTTATNELKQYWKGGLIILSLSGKSTDDTYSISNDNGTVNLPEYVGTLPRDLVEDVVRAGFKKARAVVVFPEIKRLMNHL